MKAFPPAPGPPCCALQLPLASMRISRRYPQNCHVHPSGGPACPGTPRAPCAHPARARPPHGPASGRPCAPAPPACALQPPACRTPPPPRLQTSPKHVPVQQNLTGCLAHCHVTPRLTVLARCCATSVSPWRARRTKWYLILQSCITEC